MQETGETSFSNVYIKEKLKEYMSLPPTETDFIKIETPMDSPDVFEKPESLLQQSLENSNFTPSYYVIQTVQHAPMVSTYTQQVESPWPDLKACRVCLETEIRLYNLHDCNLAQMFGDLIGAVVSKSDGLPQHICSVCGALLRRSAAFRLQCRQTHVTLQDMCVNTPVLTTETIRIKKALIPPITNLSPTLPLVVSFKEPPSSVNVANEENDQLFITGTDCKRKANDFAGTLDSEEYSFVKEQNSIDETLIDDSDGLTQIEENKFKEENSLSPVNILDSSSDDEDTKNDEVIDITEDNDDYEKEYIEEFEETNFELQETNGDEEGNIFIVKETETEDYKAEEIMENTNEDELLKTEFYTESNCNPIEEVNTIEERIEDNKNDILEINEENPLSLDEGNDVQEIIEDIDIVDMTSDIEDTQEVDNLSDIDDSEIDQYIYGPSAPLPTSEKKYNQMLVFSKKYNMNMTIFTKGQQRKEIEVRKKSESYRNSAFKCDLCFKGFKLKYNYEQHLKLFHAPEAPLSCELCQYRCTTEQKLAAHKRDMHWRQYQCKQCGEKVDITRDVVNHFRGHGHSKSCRYKCPLCWRSFPKLTARQVHLRNDHAPVTCHMCGDRLDLPEHFSTHIIAQHSEAQNIRCESCGFHFLRSEALNRHQDSSKSGCQLELRPCGHCGENFATEELVVQHLKDTHGQRMIANTLKRAKADRSFQCAYCPETNKCKNALTNHTITHMDIASRRCTICDQKFTMLSELKQHLNDIHSIKRRKTRSFWASSSSEEPSN